MNSENDTDRTPRSDNGGTSATPSTALLNRSVGTSPAPRMLTPYEVGLLRRSKQEMTRVANEALARGSGKSRP